MSLQPSFRPQIESLENREVPAGLQAYTALNNLYVLGTNSNDFIQVMQFGQNVSVTAQINVLGKNVSSINANTISNVIVYGYDGNDVIDLTTVKEDASIYDGAGNDIIRCGTGNDLVPGGSGFDQVYRTYNPLTPVVNGASASDIQQGFSPLCQTDASLAELAQQGHNFSSDIQYLGNRYYLVKLHGAPAQKVYFDGWTNSNDPGTNNGTEFWMVLMQRARLQSLGIDPTKSYTSSQWDAMNRATNNRLYSVSDALYTFTGNKAAYSSMTYANASALQSALSQGYAVIAQSHGSGAYASNDGIIINHAYAVTSVYQDKGVWKVRLYNPWGMDRENGTTTDGANDGFVTLTWQQFINSSNFVGYFIAKR